SRDPQARPASVESFADDIRRWQRERAADIEVAALLREAQLAWEGAERLSGDALLRQIDRLSAVCGRVLALRPADAEAARLAAQGEALRERAIVERERAARSRVARRAAVAGIAAAALAAAGLAWILGVKRRDVAQALEVAR